MDPRAPGGHDDGSDSDVESPPGSPAGEPEVESQELQLIIRDELYPILTGGDDRINGPALVMESIQRLFSNGEELVHFEPKEIVFFQAVAENLEHKESAGAIYSALGEKLQKHAVLSEDLGQMDFMIHLFDMAIELSPPGTPSYSSSLRNLAGWLSKRFDRLGKREDLEESIQLHREILHYLPADHVARSGQLNNLATILSLRYERLGDPADLEESLLLNRAALSLFPQDDRDRASSLTNLSNILLSRYTRENNVGDLEEAVELAREALWHRPPGHPGRERSLDNLAQRLRIRYRDFGNEGDIEDSIMMSQEALLLLPSDHPSRSFALASLASSFRSWGKHRDYIRVIDKSIALCREAVALCPVGNSYRSSYLNDLAVSLEEKCVRLETKGDAAYRNIREEIELHAREAVVDVSSSVDFRLHIARVWASDPHMGLSFRLEMHSQCLALLQQFLVINPEIVNQQSRLLDLGLQQLAPSAAATAIEAGAIELAVTTLDQGRSLLLGALRQYRTPVDTLREHHGELANELQDVGEQLEQLSTVSRNPSEERIHLTRLDSILSTQWKLREKWGNIVAKIRALPGYESFLSTSSYQQLQTGARDGPVIILNASAQRCDAIIMTSNATPSLVPLPTVSIKSLQEYRQALSEAKVLPQRGERHAVGKVLRSLWVDIVTPIKEHLDSLGITRGSRVWWCPCGSFSSLPVHAAGAYDGTPESDVPKLYISSYTTTLSDLLRAKETTEHLPAISPSLLFIGHSGGTLENVRVELDSVRQVTGLCMKSMMENEAQPSSVLDEMPKHPWVHFTCHGVVEHDKPLDSYFELSAGSLHVKDIMTARLEQAEFAYLAACHSASPGSALPDENLHLAGALQFGGFRSVIGTMWEMYDDDGPIMAKDFYTALVKFGGRHADAARALNYAIKRCRKRGAGPERWAMFIHIGA